jgi:hypothetical protein
LAGWTRELLWGQRRRCIQGRWLDKSKAHESISGLGEAAILNASPADSTLSILYKGRIVIVSTVGSKNAGIKAALIQTARQILGKI